MWGDRSAAIKNGVRYFFQCPSFQIKAFFHSISPRPHSILHILLVISHNLSLILLFLLVVLVHGAEEEGTNFSVTGADDFQLRRVVNPGNGRYLTS
jgi:hypothetical protein